MGMQINVAGEIEAEVARVVNHALLENDAYSKPIVAAVNGDCIGGGLELLLSTDIRPQCPRRGLACPKSAIYPFGGRVPHRYGRESRRTARMVTALGRSCAGAGGGGVFSREHCGQALVRHPDEGVHLAKFPGKLAPGIARIGAAEDLTVDATGQQKIGVGSVRGQVPDRAVGG